MEMDACYVSGCTRLEIVAYDSLILEMVLMVISQNSSNHPKISSTSHEAFIY